MGGNSSSVSTTRVRTRPTTHRGSAKLDKLVATLKHLSGPERREAIKALKDAGLEDLAKALKALLPTGSRPRERT